MDGRDPQRLLALAVGETDITSSPRTVQRAGTDPLIATAIPTALRLDRPEELAAALNGAGGA